MKKITGSLLILAMILQSSLSYSANSNQEKIKKTFDSFRYKMTVLGDSNDLQFKSKTVDEFKKDIQKLQADGVSNSEIMGYTRSSILNADNRKDFDLMLSSIDANKISSEDAGNMAMRFMAGKYQQGASYSGGGKASFKLALVAVSVAIVGVVTYFVIKELKEKNTTQTVTIVNNNTFTETVTVTTTNTSTETFTNTGTNTNTFTGGCCPCAPIPVETNGITTPSYGGCCQCSQGDVL